jgi:hypothetical protein
VALASELARLRGVERVALDFCVRCERGEIRSVATYERFRAAIAGPDPDATRVLGTAPAGTCTRSRRR